MAAVYSRIVCTNIGLDQSHLFIILSLLHTSGVVQRVANSTGAVMRQQQTGHYTIDHRP